MKLLFVSDIHGSLYYANKAAKAYTDEGADYMVLLGDELYHGPRNPLPEGYNPMEVAKLLNKYADRIIAVRGNCDSEIDETVLDFPIAPAFSWVLYNNRRLFLTHGHIYNEENLPKTADGDVIIYGHFHVPMAEKKGKIFIINPGSISLPKENNPNTYGILEGNEFRIVDVEGHIYKKINI